MQGSKLPRRRCTEEFKVEAARLSESVGGHEAARRLGVPVATLGNWTRRAVAAAKNVPDVAQGCAAVPTRRPVSELEAENSRLRRELADAKLEVEILRKAKAYFAKVSR
jgi:transposase